MGAAASLLDAPVAKQSSALSFAGHDHFLGWPIESVEGVLEVLCRVVSCLFFESSLFFFPSPSVVVVVCRALVAIIECAVRRALEEASRHDDAARLTWCGVFGGRG